MLNINNLCLRGILSPCKKHHIVLRNGLFQGAKWCFPAPDMGLIAPRNGHYRKAKCIIPDYDVGYIGRLYGAKQAS